jgi:hypothetical protein
MPTSENPFRNEQSAICDHFLVLVDEDVARSLPATNADGAVIAVTKMHTCRTSHWWLDCPPQREQPKITHTLFF